MRACSFRSRGAIAAVVAALVFPLAAGADDGGNGATARVERSCSGSSTIALRVRPRDGGLRVEIEVEAARPRGRWGVVVIHERRLVVRARVRTDPTAGGFAIRRVIPDWPGRDTVTVRAAGPRAEVCRASVTVAGA